MVAVSKAMHVGEKVREVRESRKLSVRTLAASAGFSPSFISQVENGQASPSIGSLERIAATLDITLAEFFGASEHRSSPVDRQVKRQRLESAWSKAEIARLGNESSAIRAMMITVAPGGSSGKNPHPAPREELAVVFSGELTLLLENETQRLSRGDAITIPAGAARKWSNESDSPTDVLLVTVREP